jgi:tetratricopeptide (TPR) repeat protein
MREQAKDHFIKGERLIACFCWDEAIDSLKEATKSDPTFTLAYGWLAAPYIATDRFKEARETIQKAKDIYSSAPEKERILIDLWGYLIDVYSQGTEKDKVAELCQKLEKDHSNDERVLWCLSIAYRFTKDKNKEKNTYERILKNNPKNLWALNALGYHHLHEGNLEKAKEHFEIQIKVAPNEANPYDSLGDAHRLTGDAVEAEKQYKKAEKLKPNFSVKGGGYQELLKNKSGQA